MKRTVLRIAALVALFGGAGPIWAATLTLSPESVLWLAGDSSLHVYHSTATELRGGGELDAGKPFPAGAIERFEFIVPVKGMRSGKEGLDKNMRKALKADEHPDIVFRLTRAAVEPDPAGDFRLKAEGTLAVAGREKPVTLDARVRLEEEGFLIEGKHDLLMTDFGVKPPVMMLGAIKTRDEVTIHYRIFLSLQEEKQETKQ